MEKMLFRTLMSALLVSLASVSYYAAWADEIIKEVGSITYRFHFEKGGENSLQFPSRAISPDGKFVLQGEEYGPKGQPVSFRLYETATNAPVGPAIPASKRTTALAVAPDNQTIAVCPYYILDSGGEVCVYDGKTGKKLSSCAAGAIKSVEFDVDSKTVKVVSGRVPKG
jgi:hypothetical protein